MRYRIFNRFMERFTDIVAEASHIACLNAAAVEDMDRGTIIIDFRTEESENDEKG